MHRPHVIFKLGHDSTRVSAVPKTAMHTPISVSNASVERPCGWTDTPSLEFRLAAQGIAAACVEEITSALDTNRVKSRAMFGT